MSVQFNGRDVTGIPKPERDLDHKLYDDLFVRSFPKNYGIQWPGRLWITCHKPLYYPLVDAHLSGRYWISKPAANIPDFFYLDFDVRKPAAPTPTNGSKRRGRTTHPVSNNIQDRVAAVIDRLGLSPGQYFLMTSPSFGKDGSCHMALRLELKGELPFHKYGYTTLHRLVGDLCEVYPQANRKFRLPFGRDQHLISADGEVLCYLDWREAMPYVNKLDPVAIESLPYRSSWPSLTTAADELEYTLDNPPPDEPRAWSRREACDELWAHGLQMSGTRNHAQWQLVVDCWRGNWLPEDTAAEIKGWIRQHHNGCSETVNLEAWHEIYGEIDRQVAWVYKHFTHYPDNVHNQRGGGLTTADLNWIAQIFHGDIVNQRRLARLINFYRPRAHHDKVFIPYHKWHEIAHKRHYHEFMEKLFALNLLESDMKYFHDPNWFEFSYCRKFKLHLPPSNGETIIQDGRNVIDYDEALFASYPSVVEIVGVTGVRRQRFYDYLDRKKRKADLDDVI